MPLTLYPRGKSLWYPLGRRLDGSECRPGRRGEEEILDPFFLVPVITITIIIIIIIIIIILLLLLLSSKS
jgi:hypothetical protein